ncbi:hypothetical protein L1987_50732 [Smallanthus sonchifolius]|uniref:Uncharacterized protein n=1 Tax=Smallanthus sonchifolius TaxID=185202 RepID=A0ACB9EP46_9ASTR|nr:hypothetical protein L1987_50732 [Smallanthus sonchifolius]
MDVHVIFACVRPTIVEYNNIMKLLLLSEPIIKCHTERKSTMHVLEMFNVDLTSNIHGTTNVEWKIKINQNPSFIPPISFPLALDLLLVFDLSIQQLCFDLLPSDFSFT